MSQAFISRIRLTFVSSVIFVVFGVLLGRLVYLHVWQHEVLSEQVEDNRNMTRVIEARRGDIVDAQGNLLATTRAAYTIGVDPQVVREADESKWPDLARRLGIEMTRLREAFTTKTRPGSSGAMDVRLIRWAVLRKEVDEATYKAVMNLDVKGVYGNRQFSRFYPARELAAHVIGYVNKEATPVMGIERALDYYLRGQDGWRESERDGRRRELARFRNREVEPSDGLNVELSIDQTVQHHVETEISRLVRKYQPQGISVIVSEPATGSVLALANYPSFEPNEFYNTEKFPIAWQRNRALTDLIEPGSTFKMVPAAAALNEGIVRPLDTFETDLARVKYEGRTVRLPDDHHNYESLTMEEIVIKSSNRGAAQLGMMLGAKRLHDYAAAFGFGEATGCVLDGEVDGRLHPVRDWDGLTITRMPMGHAISATPLQVHFATSVFANHGVLMEPRLVRRVFDRQGNEIVRFAPKARHRVVSAEVAATVAEMLAEVVGESGTARRAAIDGFRVAGKTGTTQKLVDGRYSRRHHVASFTGFLPAENPRLVITVVVDDPQLSGIGYGGVVAAPAFRNIARKCINYLGIRPTQPNRNFTIMERSIYDRSR